MAARGSPREITYIMEQDELVFRAGVCVAMWYLLGAAYHLLCRAFAVDTSFVDSFRVSTRFFIAWFWFIVPIAYSFNGFVLNGGNVEDCMPRETLLKYMIMQDSYYVAEIGFSILKQDTQQIFHHVIGFSFISCITWCLTGANIGDQRLVFQIMVMSLCEQGASVLVKSVDVTRTWTGRKYTDFEFMLVKGNVGLSTATTLTAFLLVPQMLYQVCFIPEIPVVVKIVLVVTLTLQMIYDAYWFKRLFSSFYKYKKRMESGSQAEGGEDPKMK